MSTRITLTLVLVSYGPVSGPSIELRIDRAP